MRRLARAWIALTALLLTASAAGAPARLAPARERAVSPFCSEGHFASAVEAWQK